MARELDSFIVAILDAKTDKPIGTGFVVARSGLIISAYHVAQRALHLAASECLDSSMVLNVCFPAASVTGHAEPVLELSDLSADVITLQVKEFPEGIQTAALGSSRNSAGNTFITAGYRQAQGGAVGIIAPRQLEPTIRPFPLLVLKSDQIDRGMSGAPVLDCSTDRVVGMIVATWYGDSATGKDRETSYAVPSEILHDICTAIPLLDPAATVEYHPKAPTRPRTNLPQPRTHLFTGRTDEKDRISEALNSNVPRILITGMGGVGKTSLALEIAHTLFRATCYDTLIWIPLESDVAVHMNDVINVILDALDLHGLIGISLEQKKVAALRELRRHKTLIIADSFDRPRTSSIARFLSSLPVSCQLILTSRQVSAIPEEEVVCLAPLQRHESVTFLSAKSTNKRLAKAPRHVLEKIHEVTGGIPLALEWAAGQINTGRQTVEALSASFNAADSSEILIQLFSQSYTVLPRTEQHILWSISFFERSCSIAAIESLSQFKRQKLEETLMRLVEVSLLTTNDEFESEKIRYSLHPLLRTFVQQKLEKRRRTYSLLEERFIAYYESFARDRAPRTRSVTPRDYQELELELRSVEAALDRCHRAKRSRSFLAIDTSLSYFYYTYGYWTERIKRGWQGVQAAKHINDRKFEAWMLINEIGYVLIRQGEYDKAEKSVNSGLQLLRRRLAKATHHELEQDKTDSLGLHFMLGMGLRYLGLIYMYRQRLSSAERHFKEVIQILDALNRKSILANVKTELAELSLQKGDKKEATRLYYESLNYHISQRKKKPWVNAWIARAYIGLGNIAYSSDDLLSAAILYEKALASGSLVGNVESIAHSKYHLSIIARKLNDEDKALRLASESMELYSQLGIHPEVGS